MSLEDLQSTPAALSEAPPAPVADTTPAATPEAPAPAEDDLEKSLAKVWSKHQAERDESGRFVSRETSVKQDDPALSAAEPAKTEQPVQTAPAEPEKPAVDAPRAWTAEQKALWGKIPAEAQPIIAQREAELQEIRTAAGRMAAEIKPVRDAFNQHADYLSQIGMRPEQWLSNALSLSRQLDAGHAPQVIKMLADQYGVDLGTIYDPLAPPPDQRVIELERQLAVLQRERENEQQSRAADQSAARLSEFDRLASEFKAQNPDANEIEDEIVAEIHALRMQQPNLEPAALLKQAYERAAWASEKTRAKRLEATVAEKLKAQEEARVAAAKEAAAKARSAASVNVAGSASSSSGADDIDSMLRSVYRKNHAR